MKQRDCRDCKQWKTCPCGEPGHRKRTSIGYSPGNCKYFKRTEARRTTLNVIAAVLFIALVIWASWLVCEWIWGLDIPEWLKVWMIAT